MPVIKDYYSVTNSVKSCFMSLAQGSMSRNFSCRRKNTPTSKQSKSSRKFQFITASWAPQAYCRKEKQVVKECHDSGGILGNAIRELGLLLTKGLKRKRFANMAIHGWDLGYFQFLLFVSYFVFFSFILFCFVEIGFLYLALALLEFTLQTRLTQNSQRSARLWLPNAGIKGMLNHHQALVFPVLMARKHHGLRRSKFHSYE